MERDHAVDHCLQCLLFNTHRMVQQYTANAYV